jgi:hypothetical protein
MFKCAVHIARHNFLALLCSTGAQREAINDYMSVKSVENLKHIGQSGRHWDNKGQWSLPSLQEHNNAEYIFLINCTQFFIINSLRSKKKKKVYGNNASPPVRLSVTQYHLLIYMSDFHEIRWICFKNFYCCTVHFDNIKILITNECAIYINVYN